MLGGWRKFGPEKPKTAHPFAFFDGKRVSMYFHELLFWEVKIKENGKEAMVPAIFLKDLLFMDDFRGKKLWSS